MSAIRKEERAANVQEELGIPCYCCKHLNLAHEMDSDLSQPEKARPTRPTTWLLFFLCLSLFAWRLGSREAQYHPSTTGNPATIAFFDANEQNLETFDACLDLGRSHLRVVARDHDWFVAIESAASPGWQILKDQAGPPPLLSEIFARPVSVFSNPPPPSLA